jgi:hypothetical protein
MLLVYACQAGSRIIPAGDKQRKYEQNYQQGMIMSTGFLTKILSSDVFQTICYAIILILCIANLVVIFVIVSTMCVEIYLDGGECGIGIGWFGRVAIFIVIGAVSAWGLFRGWRAGYLRDLKIF